MVLGLAETVLFTSLRVNKTLGRKTIRLIGHMVRLNGDATADNDSVRMTQQMHGMPLSPRAARN